MEVGWDAERLHTHQHHSLAPAVVSTEWSELVSIGPALLLLQSVSWQT